MRGRWEAQDGEAGFTLLELIGVTVIIALIVTAATLSLRNVTGAELRASANRLAAGMRAAFTLAVTRNAYFRLVLDLDTGAYWTEEAETRFFLGAVKEEDDDRKFVAKDRWKRLAGIVQTEADDREGRDTDRGANVPVMHRASAREVKDALIHRMELRRGIRFGGVMTGHQKEVREKGRAFIYFFPNGQVERAMVYLTDGERWYTIRTQPLTGRVVVDKGKTPVPRDFDEEEEYKGSF